MTTNVIRSKSDPEPSLTEQYWIVGAAQSGKTTRLMAQFQAWMERGSGDGLRQGPSLLLFAATGDNRMALMERVTEATGGRYPIQTTTPLAFFEGEVTLFWPLLVKKLGLRPRFPLRLRPETEQELATRLWQRLLTEGPLKQEGVSEWRVVRRVLDLYLLAASSGTPVAEIGAVLQAGMASSLGSAELWTAMGEALVDWRAWCLERGLLTYGLLTELYGQSLLPDPVYQAQLTQRYEGILADDVDEYPAIAQSLFSLFLDQQAPCLFTYQPEGGVRLGFGADPQALAQLAQRCTVESLEPNPDSLAQRYGDTVVGLVRDQTEMGTVVPTGWGTDGEIRSEILQQISSAEGPFRAVQTISRSQLLRAVAEEIITAVQSGVVQPEEIAIVGPGVDAIARYTLMEILGKQQIRLEPLTEQRPLYSSPMVRALLTLLAFVYPGLGRLLELDQVAEMLVVLSLTPDRHPLDEDPTPGPDAPPNSAHAPLRSRPRIDAVRAGLLADHCYVPHPDEPRLLPVQAFPRWDRLGYEATAVYEQILQWLEVQKLQRSQRLTPNPLVVLDRAIQTFLWNGSALAYDQIAALRELLEAAQHYWEVEGRLTPEESNSEGNAIERFIRLLRSGTITANPYPAQPLASQAQAVTLATLFQYRINRCTHRWQFWLDAGSPLWLTSSGTSLFGANLFIQEALADLAAVKQQGLARNLQIAETRLEHGLRDLLGHGTARIYVCVSELATNGQPQLGPLLPLAQLAAAE